MRGAVKTRLTAILLNCDRIELASDGRIEPKCAYQNVMSKLEVLPKLLTRYLMRGLL